MYRWAIIRTCFILLTRVNSVRERVMHAKFPIISEGISSMYRWKSIGNPDLLHRLGVLPWDNALQLDLVGCKSSCWKQRPPGGGEEGDTGNGQLWAHPGPLLGVQSSRVGTDLDGCCVCSSSGVGEVCSENELLITGLVLECHMSTDIGTVSLCEGLKRGIRKGYVWYTL